MEKCLLSIVSPVYNRVSTVRKMLDSIIQQTFFNDIEFIVIDGDSNDGTKEILEEYRDYIDILISEPDNGIYDAMNKGCELAKGKYVYFIGADDCLYDNKCIQSIFPYLNDNIDIISARVNLVNSNMNLHKFTSNIDYIQIYAGEMIPHQGIFMQKKMVWFDTKYKFSADYDLLLRMLMNHKKIIFINDVIANYSVCGSSSINEEEMLVERLDIINKYLGKEKMKDFYKKMFSFNARLKRKIKGTLNNNSLYELSLRINGWSKY